MSALPKTSCLTPEGGGSKIATAAFCAIYKLYYKMDLYDMRAYMLSWKVRLMTSSCCSRERRLKFTA